jgi:hypothetical protein
MRTYQLQDEGLDTFDANTTLGFDDDERDYGIVARMLRMLNSRRTVLLPNDRAKHAVRGAYQCRQPPLYGVEGSACRTPVRSSDGLAGPISPSYFPAQN